MNYTVDIDEIKDYYLVANLYEMSGYEYNPYTTECDIPVYGMHYSKDKEDSDFIISTRLKWDGCANWNFKNPLLLHTCHESDIDDLANAMKEVYKLGRKIPNWNPE